MHVLSLCVAHHLAYNNKPKDNCTRSCGNTNIPFPFGLEEGCFANKLFRLNCTPSNLTILDRGYAQYHVMNISLDDGSLVVSNMVNNTGYNNVDIIIPGTIDGDRRYAELRYRDLGDLFDFSQEEEIAIRWAVANLISQKAM